MARGVDIWAGELVLRMRSSHQDVHLICVLPHPDFEKRWDAEWQERVIAIYNGTKGGTRNTIEYAMQKGIEIYYAKGWEMPPANKGERR